LSFLNAGKQRFNWISAPVKRSVLREPGCVQCGARLEMDDFGRLDHAGKCFNCVNYVFDDDETFDEIEG
jgi:hypothetical protein